MFKWFVRGLVFAVLAVGSAQASTCPAYTYTFSNGSTADANQFNSNFSSILNCANTNLAPLLTPNFTTGAGITSTSTTGNPALNMGNSANNGWILFTDWASGSGSLDIAKMVGGSWSANYLTVSQSGNVGIGTTSPTYLFTVNGTAGGTSTWNVISDERLKKNVKPIAGGLELVSQLRPVRYEWRSAGERQVGKALALPQGESQIGFIAQEVEKVVPEAVSRPKDGNGVYSLKEDNLIPIMVAAIKEQQAEIQELRSELAALKPAK